LYRIAMEYIEESILNYRQWQWLLHEADRRRARTAVLKQFSRPILCKCRYDSLRYEQQ
jgi:hypothetical protein